MERYCILQAIDQGCSCVELTVRLGLSPSLCGAVQLVVQDLQLAGLVEEIDGRITITTTGEGWQRQIAEKHG